jgi:hypothetical protein
VSRSDLISKAWRKPLTTATSARTWPRQRPSSSIRMVSGCWSWRVRRERRAARAGASATGGVACSGLIARVRAVGSSLSVLAVGFSFDRWRLRPDERALLPI